MSFARRLAALATAAACLVLIAPPASADCCTADCDGVCALHRGPGVPSGPAEPAGHSGHGGHADHGGHAGHGGHPARAPHAEHVARAGGSGHGAHPAHAAHLAGPVWTGPSSAQHCGAACPPAAARHGLRAAPVASSEVPAAAEILPVRRQSLPERVRPVRTADPRGPPPSASIAL